MALEVTVVMRFEGYPPEDLDALLEDEYDCVVVTSTEEEV